MVTKLDFKLNSYVITIFFITVYKRNINATGSMIQLQCLIITGQVGK